MSAAAESVESVSHNGERLILVDGLDNIVGHDSKADVHAGRGRLHRAFSIFLFNGPDRVLLHQRSWQKPLWPGYWTNSCCSHPRQGESYDEATRRRLREELGVATRLTRAYRVEYHAQFNDWGAEHELCTVYIGNLPAAASVAAHAEEILTWGWFDCDEVDAWIAREPGRFTPWFLLEWAQLRGDQRWRVEQACAGHGVGALS